jgi:hypothetical protein
MSDCGCDPRAFQTYDEYNDFYSVPSGKCVLDHDEEKKLLAGAHKRHTPARSGHRKTISGGVVYGPCHKGPIMCMTHSCSQETAQLIRKHLSGNLVLIINKTGNCYGESHIDQVIPEVLSRGAIRCRVAGCLQDDEFVLTAQDKAGGHYHDNCTVTKTKGLNIRRSEKYRKYKLVNHLYDLCGTPEQCANDHLHQLLKHRVHKEVESLCGKVKDNTQLPDEVSGSLGGPLLSKKGYKRGPHLFLLALAMSRVWSSIRQEVLLATLVRTGYYTKERALELAELTQGQLDAGICL